jgi:hypothetical protein
MYFARKGCIERLFQAIDTPMKVLRLLIYHKHRTSVAESLFFASLDNDQGAAIATTRPIALLKEKGEMNNKYGK